MFLLRNGYACRLSVLIEQRDFVALLDAHRARLRWLVPAVAVFLLTSFAFSRELLAVFRPDFAGEGLVPLRLLAAATEFIMLFAPAPTYLKFRQHNRLIFQTIACAATVQILLLLLLVPKFGATGVGRRLRRFQWSARTGYSRAWRIANWCCSEEPSREPEIILKHAARPSADRRQPPAVLTIVSNLVLMAEGET